MDINYSMLHGGKPLAMPGQSRMPSAGFWFAPGGGLQLKPPMSAESFPPHPFQGFSIDAKPMSTFGNLDSITSRFSIAPTIASTFPIPSPPAISPLLSRPTYPSTVVQPQFTIPSQPPICAVNPFAKDHEKMNGNNEVRYLIID